ncbi:interferon-induced GTP-binding protein Mx2 [Lophiostoma macrostomum CBS 122681]|uniref:Interferon-induced GTP-binding protein Mx2 n=1 Tax=Lophiostoma macrostomum CBS 122681 TaxID=1314788 RepID=A0A6A6TD83_9PLEO|nr:interferon-induced GTP-binding protein Mx2 [Lophiostoma macrostomum CBS 122681]
MPSLHESGLTNQALLNKIDKLRDLNVKSIALPQLVVVGDQSSGKSSVLESLTGFSFPHAPGLCTRYATQISCRREKIKQVTISIIPRPNVDPDIETRLRAFRKSVIDLSNDALAKIIQEANQVMGIRMDANDTSPGLQTFSEDILKIEITGPEEQHLTVIDVPGIFYNPQPPLTTENDKIMVRNLVQTYMEESRTIILAILPANADIATQEILTMAEKADSDGVRTMGVLTKPDLVLEDASREVVKDLVLGRGKKLRLGYFIVKNRGADDQNSTLDDRIEEEKVFFSDPKWREIALAGKCGIGALKARLSELLMDLTKKELPNVKADVVRKLEESKRSLNNIGPSRVEQAAQRMYLGNLVSSFEHVTRCALGGSYDSHLAFEQNPSLKLITNIQKMNERFANDFWEKGHKRDLSSSSDEEDGSLHTPAGEPPRLDLEKFPEISDIVECEDYECSEPDWYNHSSLMEHIDHVYQSNRGAELGTFSGSILAITFKDQSQKWKPLVLAHVSRSIGVVHDYISTLLNHICSDKQVRDQLWEIVIVDELRKRYARAMDHARFLLRIERDGMPSTYNHYFNAGVQKKRQARINKSLKSKAVGHTLKNGTYVEAVPTTSLSDTVVHKSNAEQVREDILDNLASYYKVSRKRFVDVICRQVIGHFLLEGEESPLKVLCSDLVHKLDTEQLEMIAGEDVHTKDHRAMLVSDIKNLEDAMKVLRGS